MKKMTLTIAGKSFGISSSNVPIDLIQAEEILKKERHDIKKWNQKIMLAFEHSTNTKEVFLEIWWNAFFRSISLDINQYNVLLNDFFPVPPPYCFKEKIKFSNLIDPWKFQPIKNDLY